MTGERAEKEQKGQMSPTATTLQASTEQPKSLSDNVGSETRKIEIADHVEEATNTEEVDGGTKQMIGDYTLEYLIERAQKKIEKRTKDWEILNNSISLPKLRKDEIEIGRELGEGGFFKVHEIPNITLCDDVEDDSDVELLVDDDDDDMGAVQNRRFMQRHCLRKGSRGKKMDCRYAIKTMKKESLSDPG
jgi:hypothetical protein